MWRQFGAHGLGERQHIGLGRVIDRHPRPRQKACDRADIEKAAAITDQVIGKPQRQVGQRADIDGDDLELIRPIALDRLAEHTESSVVDDVFDLYAGGGLFSLPLGAQFQSAVAVESSPASFRDLRRNLPPNAKAIRSTAEAYLQNASKKLRPDQIVVDPPRAGLGAKTARALADCRAPQVTYVSCDPATLARDLAAFNATGYRIEEAHLLDLFPQTYHLETVLHLALP